VENLSQTHSYPNPVGGLNRKMWINPETEKVIHRGFYSFYGGIGLIHKLIHFIHRGAILL
jgi:hypothetical protein